jgi:hypothetical protein
MAKVERFEDLEVWQGSRDAVNAIYKISANGAFTRDQIHRAAVSIPI